MTDTAMHIEQRPQDCPPPQLGSLSPGSGSSWQRGTCMRHCPPHCQPCSQHAGGNDAGGCKHAALSTLP